MGRGELYLFLAKQVANGITIASFLQILHVALIHNLSAQSSGLRADVNNIISCPDYLFIVFHYHNGVTQLLQLSEHFDEAVGIPAMKSDTRLVQYI